MGLQFHFRNFDSEKSWFGVYHAGGGEAPWHDGRPRCWEKDIPHNPTGGHGSVYVPSDWIVHFDNWFNLIVDGLKLVEDVGMFIVSEGEDEEALIDGIKDVLDVTADAVKAAAQRGKVDLGELARQRKESFKKACDAAELAPRTIKDIGHRLQIGDKWAFIAGSTYKKYIHDDSHLVNHHGWTVLSSRSKDDAVRWQVNHAFIQGGHLIQVLHEDTRNKLWKPFD